MKHEQLVKMFSKRKPITSNEHKNHTSTGIAYF
jgi:hypothetical protein